jgi:hypothetical protein
MRTQHAGKPADLLLLSQATKSCRHVTQAQAKRKPSFERLADFAELVSGGLFHFVVVTRRRVRLRLRLRLHLHLPFPNQCDRRIVPLSCKLQV